MGRSNGDLATKKSSAALDGLKLVQATTLPLDILGVKMVAYGHYSDGSICFFTGVARNWVITPAKQVTLVMEALPEVQVTTLIFDEKTNMWNLLDGMSATVQLTKMEDITGE